jgi:hypothetical protein
MVKPRIGLAIAEASESWTFFCSFRKPEGVEAAACGARIEGIRWGSPPDAQDLIWI